MEPAITSPKNPRLKLAAELRERKARDERNQFLIDGQREIERAIASGVEILEIFECLESLEESPPNVPRYSVAPVAFAKLAYGDRQKGLVAVASQFPTSLASLAARKPSRVCIYVGVEKPGNVGALLRTADAAGIDGVILADARTDLFNPNVVRASAGALFSIPIATATAIETQAWLKREAMHVFAARVDGAIDYRTAQWTTPCALVLGSEADGLDSLWRGDWMQSLSLPMRGQVDSLNVSVTAGILLFEMTRSI